MYNRLSWSYQFYLYYDILVTVIRYSIIVGLMIVLDQVLDRDWRDVYCAPSECTAMTLLFPTHLTQRLNSVSVHV